VVGIGNLPPISKPLLIFGYCVYLALRSVSPLNIPQNIVK